MTEPTRAWRPRITGPFWTPANAVTLSRVPLALISIAFLVSGARVPALVFMVIALLTDTVDGAVARWSGIASDWGKVLDPLGDKLVVVVLGLTLVLIDQMPAWFWALLVGRDLIVGGGALAIIMARNVVPEADVTGKVSTVLLSVYLLRQAFWPQVGYGIPALDRVGLDPLGCLTLAALLVSTLLYVRRGARAWSEPKEASE
ncbi:MAG: CDP-alcohol phosphatidyltransferase family protein [Acidobacteria bacterium]|nr:CDP-alcohol phosphatidyltransferase family protein [Acidobacteriota bacterium]